MKRVIASPRSLHNRVVSALHERKESKLRHVQSFVDELEELNDCGPVQVEVKTHSYELKLMLYSELEQCDFVANLSMAEDSAEIQFQLGQPVQVEQPQDIGFDNHNNNNNNNKKE